MEKNNLYNNIAICTSSILITLNAVEKISVVKSFLILPLVLHNPTLQALEKRNTFRGLESFILNNVEVFVDFNDRFYNFFDLTFHSLKWARQMNLIQIDEKGQITLKASIPKITSKMGRRLRRIEKLQEKLKQLLEEDENNLFFYLKVEI